MYRFSERPTQGGPVGAAGGDRAELRVAAQLVVLEHGTLEHEEARFPGAKAFAALGEVALPRVGTSRRDRRCRTCTRRSGRACRPRRRARRPARRRVRGGGPSQWGRRLSRCCLGLGKPTSSITPVPRIRGTASSVKAIAGTFLSDPSYSLRTMNQQHKYVLPVRVYFNESLSLSPTDATCAARPD